MKTAKILFNMAWAIVTLGAASSCGEPVVRTSYRINLPDLPDSWLEVLGEAHWRVEWSGRDGAARNAEAVPGGEAVYADAAQEWTSAVIAWPYWPDKGIRAAAAKPAGALFPFDVSGGSINLSWNGGVDAVFFREIAAAGNEKHPPQNFNWPRFRKLFSGADLPEDILRDPWLADWKAIAAKTAASGFDRRRIVARKGANLTFTVPADGPWAGASPFSREQNWEAGKTVTVRVNDQVDSYFCPAGILLCSPGTRLWRPYTAASPPEPSEPPVDGGTD
jgi:hypothetical protein